MQTTVFKVAGMTCGSCVAKVTNALHANAGVNDVSVSLAAGEATVRFDDQATSAEQLRELVRQAGYATSPAQIEKKPTSTGSCCCH